jgi:nitrite reductase/ring-hydroxylating ferredoxin subunit
MAWTSLCDWDELKEGEGKYVEIGGYQLAVFRQGQSAFVLDNNCPHAGANLAAGPVKEGYVICPRHYWAFCLENGQLRDLPGVKISTYKTRVIEPQGRPRIVQADLPLY